MSDLLLGALGHYPFHHYIHYWCDFTPCLIWVDHYSSLCYLFHHHPRFRSWFIIFTSCLIIFLQQPISGLIFSSRHHYTYHVLFFFSYSNPSQVSDHWVFEPCFLSFLSPYYLSLCYVLGLKTTLRPWYHASCFDSSHVGDTWDWLENILIMIGQELWYDPILGHSHLGEFFYWVCNHSVWYIALGHTFLGRGLIFLNGHHAKAYFS